MKLIYVTQGMGLHVMAISDAYYNFLGDDFRFIWTRKPKNAGSSIHKHAEMGLSYDKPYIYNAWVSSKSKAEAICMINEADVVIYGGLSFEYVKQRIINKKLTFSSGERWFKRPFYTISPWGWLGLYRSIIKIQNENYFYLALSAYCANDAAIMHAFKKRVYKFAYFVPIEDYDIELCVKNKRRDILEIMWCARFIDWKHPDLVTRLAKKLVDNNITNFHINMVGAASVLQNRVKKYVSKCNLSKYVTIIDGLPNAEVRAMMKNSNIFLITSDRKEGWGAVLNEAMGAGCGIVSSNQIGSTPFLLRHKHNGLVFKSMSLDSLYKNVLLMINNEPLREMLAINAYRTITGEWSVENAAKRFIALAQSLLQGNPLRYDDGPCSLSFPCNENRIITD